jgi:hypothetical protein
MTMATLAVSVLSLAICTGVGLVLGRIFGGSHFEQGGQIGFMVGCMLAFLIIFTPYPSRIVFWLFERKGGQRKERDAERSEDAKHRNEDD